MENLRRASRARASPDASTKMLYFSACIPRMYCLLFSFGRSAFPEKRSYRSFPPRSARIFALPNSIEQCRSRNDGPSHAPRNFPFGCTHAEYFTPRSIFASSLTCVSPKYHGAHCSKLIHAPDFFESRYIHKIVINFSNTITQLFPIEIANQYMSAVSKTYRTHRVHCVHSIFPNKNDQILDY